MGQDQVSRVIMIADIVYIYMYTNKQDPMPLFICDRKVVGSNWMVDKISFYSSRFLRVLRS